VAIFSNGEFMDSIYKNSAFPHIFLKAYRLTTIFTSNSSPNNTNIHRFSGLLSVHLVLPPLREYAPCSSMKRPTRAPELAERPDRSTTRRTNIHLLASLAGEHPQELNA